MSVTSIREIRQRQSARHVLHDVERDPEERTARRLEACGYSAETASYAARIAREVLTALRTGKMVKA